MAFIPKYILILIFTIVIDYIAGILIENAAGTRRKWLLSLSIVANVGVLSLFKYYNFFAINLHDYLHVDVPLLKMILPIGLSFHTFQAMSYTIEVYRGNQKAERHFGIYSLYVMFYPQLVAGPIERPQNLLHQFHEEHPFDYNNVVTGLRQMMWGLIKKVVIADRLAVVTDTIFNNPHSNSGTALAIGAIFFAFQIYCDFSGYSDIAIGAARVMGFHLMTNFNNPYHSRSISEFWKRWHISLSTWFKDYLYIPLGGNRVAVPRMYFNLFFVFLVSGFWHGANWTFIVWGALHGFYLIFALFTQKLRKNVNDGIGITNFQWINNTLDVIITFILADIGWIFFRANNVSDGFFIVKKLCSMPGELVQACSKGIRSLPGIPDIYDSILPCFALICCLELVQVLQMKFKYIQNFDKLPLYMRWFVYYSAICCILFLGVFAKRQFIYFQF